MDPMVAKCDNCDGTGYTPTLGPKFQARQLCWKCDGNGSVVIGDVPDVGKASRAPRIIAWAAFIVLCFLAAYLIGHGGR
jgi:hypothetical protein